MTSRWAAILLQMLIAVAFSIPATARPDDASPFAKLAGRWLGEGRMGVRSGGTETVKCRVTYIVGEDLQNVQQTIRCASPSGGAEIRSQIRHAGGTITGTWQELSREWNGDLSGTVTPHGFKVAIKGSEFNANMDLIVKGDRQIIEIHFLEGALIGLTLILQKG